MNQKKQILKSILNKNPPYDALFIKTNLFTKSNGKSPLGFGLAKQLEKIIPQLNKIIGHQNKTNETCCHIGDLGNTKIYSYPTKESNVIVNSSKDNIELNYSFSVKPGDNIEGWKGKESQALILKNQNFIENLKRENMDWSIYIEE